MTKIAYVVTCGEYSDYCISKIFDTREEADKYVLLHSTHFDDYRVEEHPIYNGLIEGDIEDAGYCYSFDRWGTEEENLEASPMRKAIFDELKTEHDKIHMLKKYCRVWLPEKDTDKALKMLQDIRAYNKALENKMI